MGARPTAEPADKGDELSFIIGQDTIRVLILRPQDLTIRGTLVDVLLNLSSLRGPRRLVYLAAPRLLGSTLDAATFRSRGIGLLFFDERRIDEAVAPQPIQEPLPASSTSPPTLTSVENRVIAGELAALKSMYSEMEQTLTQLRTELTSLRDSRSEHPGVQRLAEPARVVISEPVFAHPAVHGSALPSYFTNNPWLEVLAKRGAGGNDAVAG